MSSNTTDNSSPKKHRFKIVLLTIIALIVTSIVLFVIVGKQSPIVSQAKLQSGGSSSILDYQGNEIATLGNENRDYTTSDKFSPTLKDAVVSIEDRRFYQEPFGINPIRIVKAGIHNLFNPGAIQGGSTLTQQLVKMSVFSTKKSDQTFKRKVQEAYLTIGVERNYSKQQILEFYMNKVYLANGVYGMGTASQYYFNKKANNLTLAQAALLAGMPQAPNSYDPYVHPQAAANRRNQVIDAMLANGKISSAEAQQAKQTAISDGLQPKKTLAQENTNRYIADNYIKEVINDVKKKGYDPYRDNLKIKTNLHLDIQKRLYNLANNDDYLYPDNKMQVAASVVDPKTGDVLGMIGGRKQGNVLLGLNRATSANRSNGSTMKPILDYGPAIENLNWSTAHYLEDTPYTYAGTNIALQDWDHEYMGQMTMRQALVQSRNIPAIRTLETVGLSRAKTFASGLGINIPDSAGLSVGIGSDVSTLQLASAYAAFADNGTYRTPEYVSQITTADGMVHNYENESRQVMKPSTAYMITDMLKEVISSSKGTGTNAKIAGLYQAGKTGTVQYSDKEVEQNPELSNTAKDAWFAGFTKEYSIAVWTGYDQPQTSGLTMSQQQIPVYFYKAVMAALANNSGNTNWTKPSNVVSENIITGSNPPVISNSNYGTTKELFIKGHTPTNKESFSASQGSYNNRNRSTEEPYVPSESNRNNESEYNNSSSSQSTSSSIEGQTPNHSENSNQNEATGETQNQPTTNGNNGTTGSPGTGTNSSPGTTEQGNNGGTTAPSTSQPTNNQTQAPVTQR